MHSRDANRMNLTRDEAQARARLLSVDSYDVDLDLTASDADVPVDDRRAVPLHRARSAARSSTWSRRRCARSSSTAGRSTRRGLRRHPDRARRPGRGEQPAGRRRLPLHAHRRGAAPVRRPGGQGGLPLHAVRGGRLPADVRRLRAARPQGDVRVHRHGARRLAGRLQLADARARSRPRAGSATWRFAATQRMSSYITALVAGPYHRVDGRVPRRRPGRSRWRSTAARRSREHLDAEDIFDETRQGFEFFERDVRHRPTRSRSTTSSSCRSSTPARWRTPGCVTLHEDYVFRSRVPEAAYERRAVTILHELAHMWFGDLVTMRWWDDLWLNESFAEYASTLAAGRGDPVDVGLDDVRQHRQDLGLPAGPAARRRTRSPPTSTTSRTSRSTSTASPTPRARRCSSSSPPGSAGTQFTGGHPALLPQATRGATPRWPTCSASWRRPPAATSRRGRRSGWRPPASTRCAPDFERRRRGAVHAASPSTQEAPDALADAALPPARGRRSTTASTASWCAADRVELDVTGARTDVPELVGRARSPTCVLVNDDDLTYAKIRLDERSLATLIEAIGDFEDSPAPLAVLGRGLGHDPRRRDVGHRLRRRWCSAASAGETDSSVARTLLRQAETAVVLYSAPEPGARPPGCGWPTGSLGCSRGGRAGSDNQLQLAAGVRRCRGCTDEQLAGVRRLLDGDEADRRARRSTPTCAGTSCTSWSRPGGPTTPRSTPSSTATTPRPVAGRPPRRSPPGRRRRPSRRPGRR